MISIRIRWSLWFAVLGTPFQLLAGDYANAFLEIGVGARALAMGSSFCSLADDGTAFYWNPAGLAFIKRTKVSGMYGNQFGSLTSPMGNYHYLGIAAPLSGSVVLAANWIRLAVDGIPVYASLEGRSYFDRLHDPSFRPSGEPDGSIADIEDALFFSFAKLNQWEWDLGWMYHRVRLEIPVGMNLKFIRQSLGSGSASGIGVDLGTVLRLHLDDLFQDEKWGILSWGIHLQDLTRTSMNWNTKHQDPIPVNVKWGFSYRQPLPIENNAVSISYDRDSRWNGLHHVGLEYDGFGVFGLRAGFEGKHFTIGAGVRFWVIGIDYAFLSHELDSLHRISCSVSL